MATTGAHAVSAYSGRRAVGEIIALNAGTTQKLNNADNGQEKNRRPENRGWSCPEQQQQGVGAAGGVDTGPSHHGQGNPRDESNHGVDRDREDLELRNRDTRGTCRRAEPRVTGPRELVNAQPNHGRHHRYHSDGWHPLFPVISEHSDHVSLHDFTLSDRS